MVAGQQACRCSGSNTPLSIAPQHLEDLAAAGRVTHRPGAILQQISGVTGWEKDWIRSFDSERV